MVLVHDVDFARRGSQFHEAVFTHASTSPNQQLIASLDVARRQMELEGYGLVMNAISIALEDRAAVNQPPADLEILQDPRRRRNDPREFRQSGFRRLPGADGTNWGDVVKSMRDDEFYLDPTRMTLVCGTAGFDGTQFKGLLANRTTSSSTRPRATPFCCQSNINNTRSDVAHLIRVLVEICRDIEDKLRDGGASAGSGLRSARQVVDGRRARPPQLQPLPRCLPQATPARQPTKATCAPLFTALMSRQECEYLPLQQS